MGGITIKDIAKELNFSTSTVSKALNNSSEISDGTKKVVMAYAKANNYKPNRIAQSLKSQRMHCIGVVLNSFYNSTFWAQLLDGIHTSALAIGYDVMIMQSFESIGKERLCLEALLQKGVDGILLAPVSETSNSDYITSIILDCPVVLLDRLNSEVDTTKIGVNEYKGAFEATQHLVNNNRKRILYITGDKFGRQNPRLLGFKKALTDLGIRQNPMNIIRCNLADSAEIDQKIRSSIVAFMQQRNKPDAIFGATDTITLRTLGILAELNIKVPDKVAVIGFANTDMVNSLNPPLSTIYQPAREMGYLAITKLDELVNLRLKSKPAVYETICLDAAVHIRRSSDMEKKIRL